MSFVGSFGGIGFSGTPKGAPEFFIPAIDLNLSSTDPIEDANFSVNTTGAINISLASTDPIESAAFDMTVETLPAINLSLSSTDPIESAAFGMTVEALPALNLSLASTDPIESAAFGASLDISATLSSTDPIESADFGASLDISATLSSTDPIEVATFIVSTQEGTDTDIEGTVSFGDTMVLGEYGNLITLSAQFTTPFDLTTKNVTLVVDSPDNHKTKLTLTEEDGIVVTPDTVSYSFEEGDVCVAGNWEAYIIARDLDNSKSRKSSICIFPVLETRGETLDGAESTPGNVDCDVTFGEEMIFGEFGNSLSLNATFETPFDLTDKITVLNLQSPDTYRTILRVGEADGLVVSANNVKYTFQEGDIFIGGDWESYITAEESDFSGKKKSSIFTFTVLSK